MIITGPDATVFACIVGAIVAIYLRKKNAFAAASLVFRNAFIEELNAIESVTNKGVCARDVLLRSYEKHRNAVAEFRFHLGPIKRRRFDRAWKEHHLNSEYAEVREKFDIPAKDHIYLQYLWTNADSEEDATKLAVEHIKALLKYAKP